MIGNAPEEFQAFLIGIFIGILIGLKLMLLFIYLWLKYNGYLPNKPNIASIKDAIASKIAPKIFTIPSIISCNISDIIAPIKKFINATITIPSTATLPVIIPPQYEKNNTMIKTISINANTPKTVPIKSNIPSTTPIILNLQNLIHFITFKFTSWVLLVQGYLIGLTSMISSRRTQFPLNEKNIIFVTPLNLHPKIDTPIFDKTL